MKLCKLNGIQINLHSTWFVAVGLITWSLAKGYFPKIAPELIISQHWVLGIIATLLMFISILFHEMAHTVMAMRYNVAVENITLHIFGGVAKYKNEISSPRHEIIVSVAGPAISLLLAFGFMFFKVPYISDYLAEMNLIVAGFNMLPVFPMDGGRVLRDIFWMVSGKYLKSTEKAVKLGIFIAKLFVIVGVISVFTKAMGGGIWLIMIGVFVHVLGNYYGQQVMNSDALSGVVETYMIPENDVIKLPGNMTVKEFYNHFLKYGYHCYPLTDARDKVIGMVTYWHIKKHCKDDNDEIGNYMQPIVSGDTATVMTKTAMVDAYEMMIFRNLSRLFIYEKERFVGFLTKATILRILSETKIT